MPDRARSACGDDDDAASPSENRLEGSSATAGLAGTDSDAMDGDRTTGRDAASAAFDAPGGKSRRDERGDEPGDEVAPGDLGGGGRGGGLRVLLGTVWEEPAAACLPHSRGDCCCCCRGFCCTFGDVDPTPTTGADVLALSAASEGRAAARSDAAVHVPARTRTLLLLLPSSSGVGVTLLRMPGGEALLLGLL